MKKIELDKFVQIIPSQPKVDENGNYILDSNQQHEMTEPVEIWGKFFNPDNLSEDVLNIICDNGITPVISITPTWSFKNKAGIPMTPAEAGVTNVNSISVYVETGTKVDLSATWKWQEQEGYRNPTRTNGLFGTTLPEANTDSIVVTKQNITSNFRSGQVIYCPKSGPVVNGSKLVKPSGEHSISIGFDVEFNNKAYVGQIDTNTPDQNKIKALTSRGLVSNKARNESGVTNDNAHYWCYAYPKSLGNLSKIIMNGATPVLAAFTIKEVTITNGSGDLVPYLCYITNNKGAFTNAQLSFQ